MSRHPQQDVKAKRLKQPTIAETRERMAEAGDVEGLWQVLTTTSWTLLNGEETFGQLLRAIEVQSARDPAKFAEALFTRMVGFTGYLLYRSHYYISTAIANADQDHRGTGARSFTRDVMDVYLPRLRLRLRGFTAGGGGTLVRPLLRM